MAGTLNPQTAALSAVGLALDTCDRLGVDVITDPAFRVHVPVADLRAVFSAAAVVIGDLPDLPVPDAVRAALWRDGIGTVAQLRTRTREQLLAVRGLGPARVDAIDRALRELHANGDPTSSQAVQ